VAALNATRHAVLSVVPVLPGVERAEDWDAHRDATIASLAPSGYLETILADRVASLFWRLGRVTRYETENAASSLETAEAALAESSRFDVGSNLLLGTTPTQIQETVEIRMETVRAFVTLREYEPDDTFPPERAEAVLEVVASRADVELEDLSFPFLPAEADDLGWGTWTGWTKKLVLEAVAVVAAASKREVVRNPEDLWRASGAIAQGELETALLALREAEGKLERRVRSKLLLPADGLDKVARYETHLERSLYKALHELQRLQAARNGTGGAPMAFDVDVSVGPRVSEPETYDATGEP